MKQQASIECRICQDRAETPLHLLTECEPLAKKTLLNLQKHQLEEREIPFLKPQLILHFIEDLDLGGMLWDENLSISHRKGHNRPRPVLVNNPCLDNQTKQKIDQNEHTALLYL